MSNGRLDEMPLATVLATAERLFQGVQAALEVPSDQLWTGREKGGCPPGQFAGCIQIPLCVAFLRELQRRGIPIPEQEWLVEVFDEVAAEEDAA